MSVASGPLSVVQVVEIVEVVKTVKIAKQSFLLSKLSFGLPPFGRVPGFAIRNSKFEILSSVLCLLSSDLSLPYALCSMLCFIEHSSNTPSFA